MASSFGFRVWGARGSLPRLTATQKRLGGNTICLEVLHPGERRVILDAGTGIANLGDHVLSENPPPLDSWLIPAIKRTLLAIGIR